MPGVNGPSPSKRSGADRSRSPRRGESRGLRGSLALIGLIHWLRDKLEKLDQNVTNEYVKVNLHALIRASDPETNPRLKGALEDLGHPAHPPQGERPPSLALGKKAQ